MARFNQIGGAGAAGPPGPAGSGGTSPDAPNILDDATTQVVVFWEPYGTDWKRGFQFTWHLPTTDANYAHLIEVDTTAVDANGKNIAVAPILHSLFSGTTLTFKTDTFPAATPIAAESWTFTFRCVNEDGKVTATPTVRTVAVTAPVINSVSVSEPGPRIVTNTGRAVATSLLVTPILNTNLGGLLGIQYVTIWTKYAWGDPDKGPDPITTRKGIFPITGLSTAVSLTGDNQVFITLLTSTVLSVYVALGAWDGTTIPAFATQATYTMAGPAQPPAAGNWITGANFTGLASKLQYYTDGGGGFSYKFGTLAFTATYSTHPTLFSVRCYVQNGKWNGTTWTPDPNDPGEHAFCDAQITKADTNTTIVVGPPLATPDSVTVNVNFPWPMAISTDPFPDNRIHLDAIPTAGAIITQAAFSGQTSPCSEIIFSSDGQYAYIQPSIAKALLTASPWDTATVGTGLGVVGGKIQKLPAALAPNVSSPTAVPNYQTEGGLPRWYLTGQMTLPNPFTGITNLHVVGVASGIILPELLVIPEAQFGVSFTLIGQTLFYQTPTFPRDTVSFGYTIQFWVDNSDGARTPSPATAFVTVQGTAAPFNSTAPLAPVITAATASVYYQRDGHEYDAGFSSQFTAPPNPLGGSYSVRVSRINAALQRATIDTLPGPFTAGQNYGFTGNALDRIPTVSQTWNIEFLPINADNVAGTAKDVPVTVAPNTITGLTGSEGTPFIEPGDGSMTKLNVFPAISVANSPGLSLTSPQTITVWVSMDAQNVNPTWFGLDWVDCSVSLPGFVWNSWRPTDSAKTCKVAAAIGAWAFPPGQFTTDTPTGPIPDASLPSGTFRSATFTLSVVGAPLATGIAGNGQINTRTATGAYLWPTSLSPAGVGGITLIKNGTDLVTYWGIPNGVQWTNPLALADPNFFYSMVEGWAVNSSGTQAPTADLGGVVRGWQGDNGASAIPGALVITRQINGIPFNIAGSGYIYWRMQIVNVSRSGARTIQANPWANHFNVGISDLRYMDVEFGDPPPSSVTSTLALTSANLGAGLYLDANAKIQLTGATLLVNGSFETDAPGNFTPTGWQIGGSQSGTIAVAANPAPSAVNSSARVVALSGTHSSVVQTIACNPGDGFNLTDYVFSSAANGTMRLVLLWLNSGQGFVGSVEAAQVFATGVWTKMSIAGTVPLGAAFVQVFVGTNGSTSGTWYADNVDLQPAGKTSAGNGLGFDSSGNLIVSTNAEFKFVGGQLQINQVDFTKGFNGFAVGSAAVPQITIAPNGVPLGWIGFDATSGLSGAWFKRVLIGGANPANAQIFADANGNVTVNGSIIAGVLVSATLSVLNIVGWNGAAVSIQSGVTFVGTNYNVRINQPSVGGTTAAIDSNGPVVVSTSTGGSILCVMNKSGVGNFGVVSALNANNGKSIAISGGPDAGNPSISIGLFQVLTAQQAGPGNPSFGSFANVQTWAQSLLNALRAHGLVS